MDCSKGTLSWRCEFTNTQPVVDAGLIQAAKTLGRKMILCMQVVVISNSHECLFRCLLLMFSDESQTLFIRCIFACVQDTTARIRSVHFPPCPSLLFIHLLLVCPVRHYVLQTHNKQFLACSHSALLPQRTHYLNCHAALSSGCAASVRPSISPICLFSSPHTWHK